MIALPTEENNKTKKERRIYEREGHKGMGVEDGMPQGLFSATPSATGSLVTGKA